MANTTAAAELLQVQAMEKDAARIEGIQARNQVRLQRFLNARQRTIGLDVQALNDQIEEKRRLKELQKDTERLEAARAAEIARLLESREHEERMARRSAMDSFKAGWEQQRQEIAGRRKKEISFGDAPENCGLASLQKMAGEDDAAAERRKLQTDQMRTWTLQQMEDRRYRALAQSAEDKRYADFLNQVANLSEEQDKREAALHKDLKHQIQAENQAQADAKAAARAEALAAKLRDDEELLARIRADPLLTEANNFIVEGSGRIRRDHFRGYTSGQRNLIFEENLELIKERAAKKDADKWQEKVWAAQQESWRQQLEAQDWEERQQRKQMALQQQHELEAQKKDHSSIAQRSKSDAFGYVTDDWYKNFGKSCR